MYLCVGLLLFSIFSDVVIGVSRNSSIISRIPTGNFSRENNTTSTTSTHDIMFDRLYNPRLLQMLLRQRNGTNLTMEQFRDDLSTQPFYRTSAVVGLARKSPAGVDVSAEEDRNPREKYLLSRASSNMAVTTMGTPVQVFGCSASSQWSSTSTCLYALEVPDSAGSWGVARGAGHRLLDLHRIRRSRVGWHHDVQAPLQPRHGRLRELRTRAQPSGAA